MRGREFVVARSASRAPAPQVSPFFGRFGRQDAVVVGRADRKTLKS